MTLEEAIKHCKEKAKELRLEAEQIRDLGEVVSSTKQPYNEPVKECRECANEHEQLAEWLEDYKRLLEEKTQGDLISREALKKKLQARHDNGNEDFDKGYNIGLGTAIDLIDSAPTVEYTFEEAFQKTVCENRLYCPARPQGKWIETGYETGALGITYRQTQCSNCGWEQAIPMWWNYCPNCGADMRKEGAE